MQIQESNFFATEVPYSQRYSINKNDNSLTAGEAVDQKPPSIRIREVKSQSKRVVELYNQALKQYLRIKNSIDKNNSKTHKLREEFVKVYGNKKLKYTNKSMLETKKKQDELFHQQTNNKVKTLKLHNDLGMMYTKNETEAQSNRLKEQNRKLAEDLKKRLKLKKKEELDGAKQKFQEIKKGQTEFLIRKKNMSAIVTTRAHHNYLLKVNEELQMLDSYTKLLDSVNDFRDFQFLHKNLPFNKTFYATTNNSLN